MGAITRKKKEGTPMLWKGVGLALSMALVVSCSSDESSPAPTQAPAATQASAATQVPTGTGVPTLTEEQTGEAIQAIKGFTDVQDATASKADLKVTLTLVVDPGTDVSRAKELGVEFVRLVMTFGPEDTPAEGLGEGFFDYVIIVAYPDETLVARGAKSSLVAVVFWS